MRSKKPKKKRFNDIDYYLITCGILLVIYTIVHTIIFAVTGLEASTLTVSFFGAFGITEGICCALIKNRKAKNSQGEKSTNSSENLETEEENDDDGIDH